VSRFSSIARVLMRCNGILTDCGLAGCHGLLHLLLLLLLLLLMRCVTCMLASCSTVRTAQLTWYQHTCSFNFAAEPKNRKPM
jgi:hypothetical protein